MATKKHTLPNDLELLQALFQDISESQLQSLPFCQAIISKAQKVVKAGNGSVDHPSVLPTDKLHR